jgi:hydrogenase expression/formation protein HypE
VQAACEMLGFDPLYVANEGKVIVIVPENEAEPPWKPCAPSLRPTGRPHRPVHEDPPGRVLLRTVIGGTRILDVLAGEMLPRIC